MRLGAVAFPAKNWLQLSALLAAETALAWLAVNVLFRAIGETHHGMPVLVVVVLVAGGSVLPRLLNDFGAWGNTFSAIMATGIGVTTLYAIHQTAFPGFDLLDSSWLADSARSLAIRPNEADVPVWTVILASAAAWWRGATREQPAIDAALVLLKAGAIVAFIAVMAHAVMDFGVSDRDASAAVLAFVVATLTAIAMMRQDLSLQSSGGRWFETVIVPVLAITLPAAIVVGVLSSDLSGMIGLLLDPLFWVLTMVFQIVTFIIVVLAMIILIPLVWLVSLLPFSSTRSDEASPVEMGRSTLTSAADRAADIPDVVRYLLVIAALLLIYGGVTRFRLRLAGKQGERESDLESSRVEGSLIDDLRRWLRGAFTGRGSPAPDPLAGLRGDPRWRATIEVRERYADFLRWAREQGLPREAATTPDELAGLWRQRRSTSAGNAVHTITSIYDEVRYGGSPATERDAARVTEAWQQLQRLDGKH
jgi:hypothetical protein